MCHLALAGIQGTRHPDGHAVLQAKTNARKERHCPKVEQLRALRGHVAPPRQHIARVRPCGGAVFHRRGFHRDLDSKRRLLRIFKGSKSGNPEVDRHTMRNRFRRHQNARQNSQPHREKKPGWRVCDARRRIRSHARPPRGGSLGHRLEARRKVAPPRCAHGTSTRAGGYQKAAGRVQRQRRPDGARTARDPCHTRRGSRSPFPERLLF